MGLESSLICGPQCGLTEEVRSRRADSNGFVPRAGHLPFSLDQAETSLGARFSDIALRYPTRSAVVLADETELSYSDLLQRSMRIAGGLLASLAERTGPLAILLPPSLDGIEAILGALLAGFAYLPIDPSIPDTQLDRLLAAARPVALLSSSAIIECLEAQSRLQGVRYLELAALRHHPPPAAVVETLPGQLAALFPTSGTTGDPKIVGLSHRAVLFDIGRQTNDLYLGPDDRFDLLFSLGFSASLAPLFAALLNGAQLHPLDLRLVSVRLLDWLEEREITVSTMTTATFRLAVATAPQTTGRCPRLRLLSLGGESVMGRDVAAFRASIAGGCVLQNAMAATETRTYAQYFLTSDTVAPDPLPIGWPVWGKELLLLDENGEAITGAGQGEVAVVSSYLAHGYSNDPDRTGERFKAQADGRTLFRTGDRARRAEDGCLTFLGRDDLQVKVRGHRVEPEAIEAAILLFPGVLECAVVAKEEVPGEAMLIAYYYMEAGSGNVEDRLRAALEAELPTYMQPAVLCRLDELPRAANRKIDRQFLRAQPVPRGVPGLRTVTITDDPALEAMTTLWTSVLGHSSFCIDDAFFRVGGDSLRAFRLLLLIEEQFGVRIAPNLFRERDTLRRSAELLDELAAKQLLSRSHSKQPQIVPLSACDRGDPVFCVHPISGSVEMYYRIVERMNLERPFYGIHAPAYDESDAGATIEGIASAYLEAAQALLPPKGKAVFAGFSIGGVIAYEMARQHSQRGEACPALLVDSDADAPRKTLQAAIDVMLNLPTWLLHDALKANPRALLRRGARRIRKMLSPGAPSPESTIWVALEGGPTRHAKARRVMLAALANYLPQPYSGPVVLLRAARQGLFSTREPTLGWAPYARNLRVDSLPGSHETCLSGDNLASSVEVMRRCIDSFD
jgi:non-ribosomal peptide synthetase component F/thioesterase domain-containing protein